jgi:predicted patatin/cPLA2 family phospholipase
MDICSNTGIVLEGGGFRAIFVAGVLEALHQHNLFFPYVIGVSAGAAYGVSYVSRQKGRNLATNQCINHPEYCGLKHLFRNGNFFNWEYIYKTIPTQIIPLDYQELANSSSRFQMVVTNCLTAKPEYLNANTLSPDVLRDYLTATSSLPYVAKMKIIGQTPYLDGGLVDPIPVHQAFSQGNSRLVVVLTRPKGYRKSPSKAGLLNKIIYRKYPLLVKKMDNRIDHYNHSIQEIEDLETKGKLFVIRPDEPVPIDRMENNPAMLEKVYFQTLQQMGPIIPVLKTWLQNKK